MTDEARRTIRHFLETYNTVTLATCAKEGPWATTVFFASDSELNLYFVSDRRTRHGRNLAESGRAAGAIDGDCGTWPDVRGLQLEGGVTVLEGAARLAAITRFIAKFPDVGSLLERPKDQNEETIASRLREANVYRLSPDWIRLIDNSRSFGYKEEIRLRSPSS
ncbi:MAG: pyridoxamine 5'-phosphate oxidase family protein [Syntrophobacteraceae bacterium]